MKKLFKIFLVILICFAFAVVCFGAPSAVTSFDTAAEKAENEVDDADVALSAVSGDGTQASPYVITTADEFNYFANLVKNNNATYGSAYYVLGNNIDFTGKKLVPFGTIVYKEVSNVTTAVPDAPFKGVFDGNGYSIYGININDVDCFAIIGCMTQGSVKNLSASYNVLTKTVYKMNYFGGIVGYAYADTQSSITISNCQTSGNVSYHSYNSYGIYAGGIVARVYANKGSVFVNNCVSYCDFDLTANEPSTVGGLGGYTKASSSTYFQFENCAAYGNVKLVTQGARNFCGGFVGYAYKDQYWIEVSSYLSETIYHFYNCFAVGDVYTSCSRDAYAGGFIGKIDASYINRSNNKQREDQLVEGVAKFTTIGEYADKSSVLFEKTTFSDTSFGFDLVNTWYFNSLDKKLYLRATSKKDGGATLREGVSIRLSSYNPGLRFTADIEMFKRDYVTEYGFILTTEEHLGDNELTFDYGGRYVKGVAYDSTTDIFYDMNDENAVFTGVLYNIPKTGYDKKVIARTYVKYVSGGVTYTLYGNTVSASMSEIAQTIKNDTDGFDSLSQEQKDIFSEMFPNLAA